VNWQNPKAQEVRQVKAEKLFATERDLPRPHTRNVSITAEIFPSKQEALISGKMTLQNSSGEPITELYVQPSTTHREDMRRLSIEGASEVMDGQNADGDDVKDIRKFNTRLYRFNPPLADGKIVELDFEAFLHAPRLADGSAISKNGTFFHRAC